MDCEVCGDVILGKGVNVLIDGAKLIVCRRCASGATIVKTPARPTTTAVDKRTPKTSRTLPQAPRKRFATGAQNPTVPDGGELVENYGQKIRKARQAMQLGQEEFSQRIAEKVSVLQKIEADKLVPDDSLVRKLEHALKIHLIQKTLEASSTEEKFKRPLELTLGDVAVMQNKSAQKQGVARRKR